MTYKSFKKNKDYAMTYIVPAFRKFGVSKLKVINGEPVLNRYGQIEKEVNIYQRYANAIAYCGDKKYFKKCTDCGRVYFDGFESCKNRFCPVCQKLKSLRLFAKLYPTVMKLMRQGYIVKMLTFTIKDTERLSDGVSLIKKAFRVFSHENKKYRNIFDNLYIGGIKSLEVKRGNNSKLWHPHFHALVISKTAQQDFNAVNLMWNKTLVKLVNSSDTQIYDKKHFDDGFYLTEEEKLVLKDKLGFVHMQSLNVSSLDTRVKCIYECIKYITKYDENLDTDLPELVTSLKGIRTVDSFGILRDIEKDIEELNTLSLTAVKDQICDNCGCKVFDVLDAISVDDLRRELNYTDDIYDFETKTNKLERKYGLSETD